MNKKTTNYWLILTDKIYFDVQKRSFNPMIVLNKKKILKSKLKANKISAKYVKFILWTRFYWINISLSPKSFNDQKE
jgi:hypothetical protein